MVTQCNINNELLRAKLCSSGYALKYVNAVRYGYTDNADKYFNILVFLKGAIRVFEDYILSCEIYAEKGILNRFGKKALLSKFNSLSLESENQKTIVLEEELNCVTKEDLCSLSKKVSSICSTC